MEEQVSRLIMNYIWLICILAGCLTFEGSFDNFDSSKTLTMQSLIFRNQRLEQKLSSCKSRN